jgi:membrane associated rhomboid family serine protease
MFIPLHDDTPLKVIRFQFVTLLIIVVNVGVYLATGAFASQQGFGHVVAGFGIMPGEITGAAAVDPSFLQASPPLTLITYMFLHAGWWHLISNMMFMWVFADNIEDAYGPFAFAFFYLVCGVAAGLAHIAMAPASLDPLIGASGAVSGVLGAYALLYPRARVWILLFMRLPLRIGAMWVLGGWFLLQVFNAYFGAVGAQAVAWWAHIGGFITGFAVTWMLRNRLLIRVGE